MTKANEIWEKIKDLPYDSMGLKDVESICFLAEHLPKGITILETGSLIGKSAIIWALATEGTVYTIEFNHNQTQILENIKKFGLEDKIIPICGDSISIPWSRYVDVVWLDSNHDTKTVIREIKKYLPFARLMICGHDYTHPDFPDVPLVVDSWFEDVQSTNNIWYKWIGGKVADSTVDIVSLFIGREYCLPQFLEGLKSLDYPKSLISLIWHDTSNNREFQNKLLSWIEDNKHDYANVTYLDCRDPHFHFEENETENAMKYITEAYNHCLDYSKSDYFFALEDDVVGPVDGLKRLLGIVRGDVKGACAVNLYRPSIKFFNSTPILWDFDIKETFPGEGIEMTSRAVMKNERKFTGIENIGSGHLGFTLIDGNWVRKNRFKLNIDGVAGCDTNVGLGMAKQNFKYSVDWSIKCKHYDIDGGYV